MNKIFNITYSKVYWQTLNLKRKLIEQSQVQPWLYSWSIIDIFVLFQENERHDSSSSDSGITMLRTNDFSPPESPNVASGGVFHEIGWGFKYGGPEVILTLQCVCETGWFILKADLRGNKNAILVQIPRR